MPVILTFFCCIFVEDKASQGVLNIFVLIKDLYGQGDNSATIG